MHPGTITIDCDVVTPQATPKTRSKNDCVDSTLATITDYISAKHRALNSNQDERPSLAFAKHLANELDLVKDNTRRQRLQVTLLGLVVDAQLD